MEFVRWSPFRELEAMEQRMRRLFPEARLEETPLPAADVYETEGAVVVEVEVPGYEESELTIEVSDHTLSVKGERAEEKEEKEKTFHRHERLVRSFERRFEIPPEADADKLEASFAKGVLKIAAPKLPEAKPRAIAIAKP